MNEAQIAEIVTLVGLAEQQLQDGNEGDALTRRIDALTQTRRPRWRTLHR